MLERLCRAGCITILVIGLSLSASADPASTLQDTEAPPVAQASDGEPSDPWTSALFFGTRGHSSRPSTLHPYRGLRAMAHPFKALALWAQSQGFHLSRRSALYDVQGGASIALDEGVSFTASYRMSGVDLGFDGDIEKYDVEPSIQATFVGLSFDF